MRQITYGGTILHPTYCNIISNSFLFSNIALSQWQKYLPQIELVEYPLGDTIFSQDSYKKALGIILSGKVTVMKKQSLLLTTLSTGNCFGVAGIFSPTEEYVSTLTAKTAVTVAYLSPVLLEQLFKEIPQTATNYIGFLSCKINFLNKKIDDFTAPSTESTLENWIAHHQVDGTVFVEEGYTSLAKKLNIGRASLYRSLDTLASQNKITRDKKHIYIVT